MCSEGSLGPRGQKVVAREGLALELPEQALSRLAASVIQGPCVYLGVFQTGQPGGGHHSKKWIPGPQAAEQHLVAYSCRQEKGVLGVKIASVKD